VSFLRTLVESEEASIELDRLRKAFPRFEDYWLGWSWRLAHGPDRGAVCVPGIDPPVFVVRTFEFIADMPTITILYRFSDDEVEILGIREIEV
jgi:hypothetical protein